MSLTVDVIAVRYIYKVINEMLNRIVERFHTENQLYTWHPHLMGKIVLL
jgi:hypothetical protein